MDITTKKQSLEIAIETFQEKEKELVKERDKIYDKVMHMRDYGLSIAEEIETIRRKIREWKKELYKLK